MEKEQIVDLFMRGQDCGQVVFSHYAGRYGFDDEEANRLTATFGGGNGAGETCGAVLGAMMVIGMECGHKGPDDMDQRTAMMGKRAEFLAKWKERRESCMCRDMLGYDLSTPEGLSAVLEAGLLFDRCPEIVMDAIDIIDEILEIDE